MFKRTGVQGTCTANYVSFFGKNLPTFLEFKQAYVKELGNIYTFFVTNEDEKELRQLLVQAGFTDNTCSDKPSKHVHFLDNEVLDHWFDEEYKEIQTAIDRGTELSKLEGRKEGEVRVGDKFVYGTDKRWQLQNFSLTEGNGVISQMSSYSPGYVSEFTLQGQRIRDPYGYAPNNFKRIA